ncbi:hypothetical protein [Sphingomonas glaciei]|uniref:Uncharacterized protein n=1 Tax=Sphingomonas glaciei TaxID=2938948 RepID=A0ABY5MYG7_9SPHN|nr:hypothetical protein [Sphingomonas glaciei]UUR09066.1 hypothetical protein M1K48_05440 [Sphingomonas glaciei]
MSIRPHGRLQVSGLRAAVAAAFLLSAFGSPASAQIAPGRSGLSSSTPVPLIAAYRDLQLFGECIAKSQRKVALLLIETTPDSKEEEKAFDKYVFGEGGSCLSAGSNMTMSLLYARGAIAEGLLRSSEGIPDTFRLAAPAATETRNLHAVARCYAAGNRQQVLSVLKTRLGTPEEVRAVAAIWPGFRTCMPGFTVRLNAPWIRFLLAEALLRLDPTGTQS